MNLGTLVKYACALAITVLAALAASKVADITTQCVVKNVNVGITPPDSGCPSLVIPIVIFLLALLIDWLVITIRTRR